MDIVDGPVVVVRIGAIDESVSAPPALLAMENDQARRGKRTRFVDELDVTGRRGRTVDYAEEEYLAWR